jgi:3-oxoacyl-[acyl-carrier-protein] synthase II
MDREVWITGYGLINGLGETPEAWAAGLADPAGFAARVDGKTFAPFPIHDTAPYDLAAQVPKPGDQRAMGPMMQHGAYAAGRALDMAGLKGNAGLLVETHLVAAAGGGERDWNLDKQILAEVPGKNDRGAVLNRLLSDGLRPTLFLAQLPNLFAGNISIIHGVSGSSRTFMGEEQAGLDAVRVAHRRCAAGQGDIFLVGAAFNAARPDLHLMYHGGGILLVGPWRSLAERPAAGIALGSAGAFVVIEARSRAEARGVRPRARLVGIEAGWVKREPASGAAASGAAALMAHLPRPTTPFGVLSGASGYGPAMAEERAFLAGLPQGAAVRATAAAFGHAMEAAFVQNLVIAASCLEQRRFPPPLAAGEAPLAAPPRQILVTSFGHLHGEGLALLEATDG